MREIGAQLDALRAARLGAQRGVERLDGRFDKYRELPADSGSEGYDDAGTEELTTRSATLLDFGPARLVTFAAAALDERAMPARTLLEHAAVAVGAEFEELATEGTTGRPTIDDEGTPRRGAMRLNWGTRGW